MKKRLTENLGLKLFSVLLGFLVWLIVANIDDPIISRSFTVKNVELLNEAIKILFEHLGILNL